MSNENQLQNCVRIACCLAMPYLFWAREKSSTDRRLYRSKSLFVGDKKMLQSQGIKSFSAVSAVLISRNDTFSESFFFNCISVRQNQKSQGKMSDSLKQKSLSMQYVRIKYRTASGRDKASCRRVVSTTSGDRHQYIHLKGRAFVSIGLQDATYYRQKGEQQFSSPVLSLQMFQSVDASDLWCSSDAKRKPKFLSKMSAQNSS